MKREGSINTVENIEQLILSTKDVRLIKGGRNGNKYQSNEPSAIQTRVYEVWSGEFVFTIQLGFDYRINRGRVTWQHKENTLFQAVPGLRKQLLSLRAMSNGWKTEVEFKKHIDNTKPEVPYEIRQLIARVTDPEEDEWGKNAAIESLANIRDYIDLTITEGVVI